VAVILLFKLELMQFISTEAGKVDAKNNDFDVMATKEEDNQRRHATSIQKDENCNHPVQEEHVFLPHSCVFVNLGSSITLTQSQCLCVRKMKL
jgi:hypothetical protein